MSQIEPKKTYQSPRVGRSSPVSAVQNATGITNAQAIELMKSTQINAAEDNNAFFRWARAGRFARLFSIKSPQPIDRQALLHQSNEALIAKLTSIDAKLEAVKGTPFQDIHNGELTLGRVIIGEQIRRLRLAVAGKENRHSVKPNKFKSNESTPTQKIIQGDDSK